MFDLARESEGLGSCSGCSSHVLCVLQNMHLPLWPQIPHLWKMTALGVSRLVAAKLLCKYVKHGLSWHWGTDYPTLRAATLLCQAWPHRSGAIGLLGLPIFQKQPENGIFILNLPIFKCWLPTKQALCNGILQCFFHRMSLHCPVATGGC